MVNFQSLSPERRAELSKIFCKDTQRRYNANPYNNVDSCLLFSCAVGVISLIGYCLWN